MKKICIFLLVSVFSFASISLSIADEMFGIKGGFITLNPEGKFASSAAGIGGARVDIDSDMNIGRSYSGTVEAYLQFGDSRITASYLPLNFTGTNTLSSTISFRGKTFTAGASVESTLKADIFDIGYTYFLLNFDDLPSRLQVGVEAAVKVINAEVGMKSASLSLDETASETVPVPTIGLRGRVAIADLVGITARVSGLVYGDNHFIDSEITLEYSPVPLLGIYAGYRYMSLKVDKSDVFVDTRLMGPTLGLFARF